MTRRDFAATAALPALAAAGTRLPIRKAVLFEMLPKSLSIADRCKLAVGTGFQSTECPTAPDERTAEEIKKASEAAGLPIHSVMNMAHWKYPLSSADPAVVAESVKGIETSLRNAHFWAPRPCSWCQRWSIPRQVTRMPGLARNIRSASYFPWPRS